MIFCGPAFFKYFHLAIVELSEVTQGSNINYETQIEKSVLVYLTFIYSRSQPQAIELIVVMTHEVYILILCTATTAYIYFLKP